MALELDILKGQSKPGIKLCASGECDMPIPPNDI